MTLRPSAFTLLETVIVVAVSLIMMIALSLLLYTFNKSSLHGKISAQSYDSAGAVLREIEALALPASAVLETHAFASATHTSTTTSLVLQIPSIDNSGNVIANTHDYAAFYFVGTSVYRLLEKNAQSARVAGTKLLSTTLGSLTFSYDSATFSEVRTVTADIETQATVKDEVLTTRLREQIRLRNHE